jgi:hypothetical protein
VERRRNTKGKRVMETIVYVALISALFSKASVL